MTFEELSSGDTVTYTVGADRHRPGMRAAVVRRGSDADGDNADGDNPIADDETHKEVRHGTIQ